MIDLGITLAADPEVILGLALGLAVVGIVGVWALVRKR